MQQIGVFSRRHLRIIIVLALIIFLLGVLLLNRLGSLAGGLSQSESQTAVQAVGWHGVYHNPLYLPLKLVRSVIFAISTNHGQALTRLPNVLFGALTIFEFGLLIRLWHGTRNAILATILFATGAWTLHVSRLASNGVMFLWLLPTIMLISASLKRYGNRKSVWYLSLVALGLILYIPGTIWLIFAEVYFSRTNFIHCWRSLKEPKWRLLNILIVIISLPLLLIDLTRHNQLMIWLGLPTHWPGLVTLLKQFAEVPIHLFVRGPEYPTVWLGKAPIFDIATLIFSLVGIYFYATHLESNRSKHLFISFLIGWLTIAFGGAVYLSLLVPFMYMMAATGITYLLQQWLSTFPLNPIARGSGIVLVTVLVLFASLYNLRAYFVAWPHDPTTRTSFHYYR